MPLLETTIEALDTDLANAPADFYLIFTSAVVDGRNWCGLCPVAEPELQRVFGGPERRELQ